jgi:hypothetical protein
MREEDVRRERAAALFHQLMTQGPEATPRIEYDQTIAGTVNTDARGVSAVASGVGTRCWNGAAGSPECQCVRHV